MDFLSAAAIRLPCSSCGESYLVPLRDILLSHQIMHQGCPVVPETECPPIFQVRLASERAVKALEQAWRRVERRAAADGGELVLVAQTLDPASAREQQEGKKSRAVQQRPSRPRAA